MPLAVPDIQDQGESRRGAEKGAQVSCWCKHAVIVDDVPAGPGGEKRGNLPLFSSGGSRT